MNYRVTTTDQAHRDLDRLLGSLAERSTDAATRLTRHYDRALGRLRTMPLSCGLAFENPSFPEEIRHLLFGANKKRRYRALFTVRGDEVVILAVRAPGEKPVSPEDLE